jgi:formate hydrogenlyase subunit 6/NADH:ubiquinone oxidoreductase subunit I
MNLMPQRRVILDYQRCDPCCTENGICPAALVCERKVLTQEGPGELPDLYPARCLGCVHCLPLCLTGALQLMR